MKIGNQRTFLFAVLMIIIVGACIAVYWWTTNTSSDGTEIRYGGQYYPEDFLLYAMPDFWEKYDLKVKQTIFSSAGESNEALLAGTIDINVGADTRTIALFNANPTDMLIIGVAQRGNRYTTIIKADSNYDSWDDLIGKTVATKFGTGAEGVLRKYYDMTYSAALGRNYKWEDFNYVNLNVEDMISALESGQIEAFTAWEPTPAIAEAQGVGKMLRTYGDVALVPACYHTTKTFAYNNRDLIVKFLAAQLDKTDMINNNITGAAEMAVEAAEDMGVEASVESFETIFSRIDFTIEFDYTVIQAIYDTAEFLMEQGKIDKMPVLTYDATFLEEAKALRSG